MLPGMEKPLSGTRYRLLVIDDTPSIHEDYRKILTPNDPGNNAALNALEATLFDTPEPTRRQSFEVDYAFQGEEGVRRVRDALAEERPYALAFIDMRMPPGWDGVQTIQAIWDTDPDVQVALCTAFSDFTLEQLGERLDMRDRLLILKKPFDSIEIQQIAITMSAKWQQSRQLALHVADLERVVEFRSRERVRMSTQLHFDALTGLPNAVMMLEDLQQAIGHGDGQSLAVIMIGMDRLTHINDAWGYPLGDALLVAVAQALRSACGPKDMLYRIESDQFVLILPQVTGELALREHGQALLDCVRLPRVILDEPMSVTASLGISRCPQDGNEARKLIKRAESAMYEAKTQGRNRAMFYQEELKDRARARQDLESNLRRALEMERFELHYQPKLDLNSGAITSIEALLRWPREDGSLLPPDRFIPLAEETGLIVPITRWVLNQACSQTSQLQRDIDPALSIAVNISAVDFRQPEFEQTVLGALDRSGLSPRCLELEITEGVLMDNWEHAAGVIQRLRDVGVRFSIDDFGTGFSSLSYLRRFEIDTLKIDKSFVHEFTINPRDAALVRAIISMGKSMGLKVIAEGVETQEQLEGLLRERCDVAQGYLISRPLQVPALLAFFRQRPPAGWWGLSV